MLLVVSNFKLLVPRRGTGTARVTGSHCQCVPPQARTVTGHGVLPPTASQTSRCTAERPVSEARARACKWTESRVTARVNLRFRVGKVPGQQGSEARLTQPGPTGPGVRVWLSHVFLGRVTASLSAHTPALARALSDSQSQVFIRLGPGGPGVSGHGCHRHGVIIG